MENQAVLHKQALEQLARLITQEQGCAAVIAPDNKVWTEELEEQRRKSGDQFMVLIVGIFSTGKSSMINALIGEKLLPSGLLPETGVLTELHYGDVKRITLYPKPGKYISDAPFDLEETTSEEIKKYVSLNTKARRSGEQQPESPFQKMVIYWPLPILKEGIVLVDTVGLDDPYGNGEITQRYLSQADAILYLLSCEKPPATEPDRNELTMLQAYGFQDILFTYTHHDVALQAYEGDDEGLQNMKEVNYDFCSDFTSLGEDSIHYVDSRLGLAAAVEGNEEQRVQSGYPDLEKFLETYLVGNKGKEQIRVITAAMKTKYDAMAKSAEAQDFAARTDQKHFEEIAAAKRKDLNAIAERSKHTGRSFRALMNTIYPEVETQVRQFLTQVPKEVNLDDYNVQTQLPSGFARLNPIAQNKKMSQLTDELRKAYEDRIKEASANWARTTLTPYIQGKVTQYAKTVEQEINDIAADLTEIETAITGVDPSKGTKGKALANAASGLVYGLITQDWISAATIGAYGMRKFTRTLLADVAAGVVGGIIFSITATFSMPILIAAVAVANLLALVIDSNKAQIAAVKREVSKNLRKTHSKPDMIEQITQEMMNYMKNQINEICDAMDEALASDLRDHELLINQSIEAAQSSVEERANGIRRRKEALEQLEEIFSQINGIRKNYGLEAL